MATLKLINDTDLTLYTILRDADLLLWNTDGEEMEAYDSENYADYVIEATEQGDTGLYYVVTPAELPVGIYSADWRLQAGDDPAESDFCIGLHSAYWDGANWFSDWAIKLVESASPITNSPEAKIAAAKAAAEAVDTLTKADGDGDLAEVASNVAETLATMPSAATIAAAVWDATTRTLSSFGTLVASIWAAASRTLTGSTLGLGPTASRSRTDGYYTCPQSGTIGLYRRILGWDGADLQQADVQSIAYSIFALSDDDPPERTAVEGHKDVELDKIAVLFDEVQSDEWASDYNFKHIPDISTNQAFPEADAHYLVEYRLTPTAGQVIVERIKVRAI